MRAARIVLSSVLVVGLSSSCALRARYRDFVTPKTEGKEVQLLVTDGQGAALPNVKVEMSEWKNRLVLTSAADGRLTMPVDKKYLDENPVLVVQLPAGMSQYTLALAPPPLPPPPPVMAPPALPTEPTPAPAVDPAAPPATTTPAPASGATTP
ncbi:MAG: hypothetical protein GQE15_37185 [Archangiaceae bacterium]|nr:hypothetical protein [Archangiaceae bacterium]